MLQLSKHDPSKVYLAARTETKAQAAIKTLQTAVPNAHVEFISCDLTSLKSVQSAARAFVSKEQRLDILVLNAGIMATPHSTTDEGYEIQFGTNHMGHALLTKLLLPTLLNTASEGNDVRVVSLSSMGHLAARSLPVEKMKSMRKDTMTWTLYAQSKLANILFAKELARRYPSITAVAVHPGVIYTQLYDSAYSGIMGLGGLTKKFSTMVYSSVPEGAKNSLWASTAKKGDKKGEVKSGEYYTPVGVPGKGSSISNDTKLAEQLWVWTEKELAEYTL
jgi:retinol dehydrogenase-12